MRRSCATCRGTSSAAGRKVAARRHEAPAAATVLQDGDVVSRQRGRSSSACGSMPTESPARPKFACPVETNTRASVPLALTMSWAAIGSATVPPPPPRYRARRRAALNGRPDRRRQPAPLPPRPRRLRSRSRRRHRRGVAAVHLRRGGTAPARPLADSRPALGDRARAGGRPLHRDRDRPAGRRRGPSPGGDLRLPRAPPHPVRVRRRRRRQAERLITLGEPRGPQRAPCLSKLGAAQTRAYFCALPDRWHLRRQARAGIKAGCDRDDRSRGEALAHKATAA